MIRNRASEPVEVLAEAPDFFRVEWKESPGLRKLYFYAAILCIASATTGYDGSMLNAMQFFPSWKQAMGQPSDFELGRLTAMFNIGSIVSLVLVPILSDRFGRRLPIIIGCFIMVIAAGIQSAAINEPMFEGARFFMGFGNSLAQLSAPLLLTEICHPQHRGRVTAVYNCLWNVGALTCSWISFGTSNIENSWAWRTPTLVQALPSIIQLTFIWWIPESPRWLLSKDRNREALQMLGHYHADGNEHDPIVQFEYAEMKETIRLEMLAKRSSSYTDFFKSRGNRYRLAIIISLGLFSQWSGNALFSYYANKVYTSAGITNTQAGLGLDGGNKMLSLIVSISCALLCDRVGRRPLFLAATIGMLLFLTAATVAGSQFSKTDDAGVGIVIIAAWWCHGVCYAFAWSGLLVAFCVEILPFTLRAKGLVIMNFSVQLALTVNNYVNPIPLDGAWKGEEWKLYCVYTCWIAFELIFVYLFYVETKGPTLEEIARIFDGRDAQVGLADIKEVPGLPMKCDYRNQPPVNLPDWRSGPGPETGFSDMKESYTPHVRYDYRQDSRSDRPDSRDGYRLDSYYHRQNSHDSRSPPERPQRPHRKDDSNVSYQEWGGKF